MCEHYKYMLQIKPEFDIKFKKTGIRSQMIYLCEVEDVASGLFKLHYDKNRFNLIIKECGKCHVCRFKRASIKACQAQCEYKTTGKGAFITLTFGDQQIEEYLKTDPRFNSMSDYKKKKYKAYLQWTLEKREFQLFMKRLRYKIYNEDLYTFSLQNGYIKNYLSITGKPRKKIIKCSEYDYSDFKPRKIRFLHCGEYGECKNRPHHHAIIFGIDFGWDSSKVRWSWKKQRNIVVHFNNMLSDLWKFGDITTDSVSYQTCNYVARYVTKKVFNKNKDFSKTDVAGSVYRGRLPEYCTQSNRRGLGYDYYMTHYKDINSDLSLTFKNNKGEIKEVPLPRYFKELMRKHFKTDWLRMMKISLDKSKVFSSTYEDHEFLLVNQMFKDRRDSTSRLLKFKGNFETSPVSSEKLRYLEFEYKKQVFSDLSTRDIYMSKYNDSDFVDTSENWRITCYKNFEKFRKHQITKAINDYAKLKFDCPDMSNLMLSLSDTIKRFKTFVNPFRKDELDNYYNKVRRDFRKEWLNYEPNYT